MVITPKPSLSQQTHVLHFHRQRKLNNDLTNLPARQRKLFLFELSRLAVSMDHIHWIIAHLSSLLCLHSHSLEVIVQWKSPIADMFLSRQWSSTKPRTLTRADSRVWLCLPSSKMGLLHGAGIERDSQAGHRTSSLSEGFYLENINKVFFFFLSGGAQVPDAT